MLAPKYLTYPNRPAVGLTIVICDPAEPEILKEPVLVVWISKVFVGVPVPIPIFPLPDT
jgi:hypothetical protein